MKVLPFFQFPPTWKLPCVEYQPALYYWMRLYTRFKIINVNTGTGGLFLIHETKYGILYVIWSRRMQFSISNKELLDLWWHYFLPSLSQLFPSLSLYKSGFSLNLWYTMACRSQFGVACLSKEVKYNKLVLVNLDIMSFYSQSGLFPV